MTATPEYEPYVPPDFKVTKYVLEWDADSTAFVASVPDGVIAGDPYKYIIGVDEHPVAALAILREAMYCVAPLLKADADGVDL